MARRRGQGQHQPQHLKGFRPGKAPPELKKRHAKQQFGEMTAAQERMVDLFAGKSPEEARKTIRRWRLWSLIGGIVLSILTVLAWMWSWIAGMIVGVFAGVVIFAHLRVRLQTAQLEEMAETVAKVTGGGKRR